MYYIWQKDCWSLFKIQVVLSLCLEYIGWRSRVASIILMLCCLSLIFTFDPCSSFDSSWCTDLLSFSVLYTILPLAFICGAIRMHNLTNSIYSVIFEFTCELLAVGPLVYTLSIHFVAPPFAIVLPSIWPFLCSFSADLIVPPVSNINCLISPLVSSLSMLFAENEISIV